MKTFLCKINILWIFFWMIYNHSKVQANFTKSSKQSAPIIAGSRAHLGQFPWHVLLRRDENDQCLCGGSLISDKWVLTAAHCVYNRNFVHLEFGTINLYFDGLVMNSTNIFIYPGYNNDKLINDIALIKLPAPIKFTENIKAVDLVSTSHASNDFVGRLATVSGFGWPTNRANYYSEWLLWATVEIISNPDCASKLKVKSIEATAMCAVGYSGTDMSPCKGDSGGALIWKNEHKKFVQIGVVSFSKKNMCSEFPTAYARVTSFLDYIRNITGLKFR